MGAELGSVARACKAGTGGQPPDPRDIYGQKMPKGVLLAVAATVKQELPEGFQTSEFLLKMGFVDRIVDRQHMRTEIARIIDYCGA